MKSNETTEHKKYYNQDGVEIPSVTTILKIVNSNLDGWANYMGLQGVNTKLYVERKANYGSYIHSICEKFFKGLIPENLEEFEIDTDFINYIQFEELYKKLVIVRELFLKRGYKYYACELSISGDKFGGTIDLILYNELLDEYIIVDFKTSKKAYSKYFIQLAGYTSLFRQEHGFRVKAVCVILIDKPIVDREFLSIRQVEDNEYNIHIFNNLLNIYYSMTDSERRFYFGAN